MKQIGWLVCLLLAIALALGGLKPGRAAVEQALGVRDLLRAAGFPSDGQKESIICLRSAGNENLAKAALVNISDGYLKGVGLCLAGETEAGMAALKATGGHSNANVQYAAALSGIDLQAGTDAVVSLDLSVEDLTALIQKTIDQPKIDPRLLLRYLAQRAPTQPETWALWIQGSMRLEAAGEWKDALEWMNEGISIAPAGVRSSLYLHAGQIEETRSVPLDYHAALEFFNQAIEHDSWIKPEDKVSAYIERGAVYRVLKDEFGLNLALEDFNSALTLQPDNYWGYYEIGILYLYDVEDLDQAEASFQKAVAINSQYPYAYYYLGEIALARGDEKSALDWNRKALERQPDWQAPIDRIKVLEGK